MVLSRQRREVESRRSNLRSGPLGWRKEAGEGVQKDGPHMSGENAEQVARWVW